jgi:predicted transcriptional regulator
VNQRPIVLSVKLRHANNILAGTKTWEYRKTGFDAGTTVLMYRSGKADQRGLVAAWRVGDVISGTAADHWTEIGTAGGVDAVELAHYAGDRLVWRHQVTHLSVFPETLTLARLYGTGPASAPQSWRFAPEDWAEWLGLKTEVAA